MVFSWPPSLNQCCFEVAKNAEAIFLNNDSGGRGELSYCVLIDVLSLYVRAQIENCQLFMSTIVDTVSSRLADTPLLRTPHYYEHLTVTDRNKIPWQM